MERVRERCSRAAETVDEADIRFDDEVELRTGEQELFTVTLTSPDVPRSVAPTEEVKGRVSLACEVSARLVAIGGRLAVEPSDWSDDVYVPPDSTTWTWVVEARTPGTARANIELRPVLRQTDETGEVSIEDLGTEDYPVTFSVTRSGGYAASALWAWIAGGVGVLAVGIPAAEAARRLFKRRAAESSTRDTSV